MLTVIFKLSFFITLRFYFVMILHPSYIFSILSLMAHAWQQVTQFTARQSTFVAWDILHCPEYYQLFSPTFLAGGFLFGVADYPLCPRIAYYNGFLGFADNHLYIIFFTHSSNESKSYTNLSNGHKPIISKRRCN